MTARRWRPLLHGDDAAVALAAVDDIARAVAPRLLDDAAGADLADGAAGGALLFAALERAGRREPNLPSARLLLRHAVARVRRDRPPPGLWVGRAGVAFALAQVAGRPPTPSLATWLARWVRDGADAEHDLVSGVAGVGALAFELRDDDEAAALLEAVVDALRASAVRRDGGLAWVTPLQRADAQLGPFDLGVAHGVAGVVGVLAGAVARRRPPSGARELLEGAVAFLLAQRLAGAAGSLPYAVGGARDREPARLAWCYGDASAAITLLLAAHALGGGEAARAARELAGRAAVRPAATAGVVDAGLCHGAAGLGQLFGRLWQLTGDEACAAAARRWLAQTLSLRRPDCVASVAGFHALVTPVGGGPREPQPVAGLLTGAAGIGLALLAACHEEDPGWDRALVASPAVDAARHPGRL